MLRALCCPSSFAVGTACPVGWLPVLPCKLPVCLPSRLVQCEAAPSVDDIIDRLLEAEPKPVADMSADERQAALLAHLCHMQVRPANAAAAAARMGLECALLGPLMHGVLHGQLSVCCLHNLAGTHCCGDDA